MSFGKIVDMKRPGSFEPPQISAKGIGVIVSVLFIVVFLWTSFYQVPAESEGVVLRFGKYLTTAQSGLNFKIPFGVDSVTVVPTRRQLKMEFGFFTPGLTDYAQASNEGSQEKAMVTGDLNAALVEWVVQYRVQDPRQFLFDVRDPRKTLRDLSEAAMREVVGDRTVDEVITVGRQEIEVRALIRLQTLVKLYQLGIVVDQVQLINVNPPQAVQDSFNEVNKAQQDRENMINLANGEYNRVIPKAKGEADSAIQEAEGYQIKRINEAQGDVAAFNFVLEQYIKAPQVTRSRLYFEAMQTIIPQAGQKIVVDDSLKQWIPFLGITPKLSEERK